MTAHIKWISDNLGILSKRRINHIVLPASHDTGAYLINWNINPSLGTTIYQKIYNAAQHSKFIKNVIEKWTLTQEYTVYNQLLLGIRNLDLRLACIDDIFYLAHTYICDKFDTVLGDIVRFLQEHPKEILFLRFRSDYENRATMTKERNDQVLDKVHALLGSYLIPRTTDNSFPTLGNVLSGSGRIILYYRGNCTRRDYVWSRHYVHGGWTTTTKVSTKLTFLANELKKMKRTNRNLNELGFTLTPGTWNIVSGVILPCIAPNGLHYLAQEIQATLPVFINDNQTESPKISAITTDFPTVEFISNVININKRN